MRRIGLAVVLALSILAPLAAEGQQAAKVARIGYLGGGTACILQCEAFRQGLRDLGYVEGRDVVIEYRGYGGNFERLPALVTDLVALKVNVIVVTNTPSALAAKQATTTLPIVFTSVGDPVASGLVTSLRRPGGNVTGFSVVAQELVGKWLELLKQAVPDVSRVALLVKTDDRSKNDRVKAAAVAARAPGGAASSRGGATSRRVRQGLLGHDQGARGCSGRAANRHVRQ